MENVVVILCHYKGANYSIFQACVTIFLLKFYFSLNDSPSKTMKFFLMENVVVILCHYKGANYSIFQACVTIFLLKFYFSLNDSPSKTMKFFFLILSKKLFLFSRYSDFCIFIFPFFPPVSHCFRR